MRCYHHNSNCNQLLINSRPFALCLQRDSKSMKHSITPEPKVTTALFMARLTAGLNDIRCVRTRSHLHPRPSSSFPFLCPDPPRSHPRPTSSFPFQTPVLSSAQIPSQTQSGPSLSSQTQSGPSSVLSLPRSPVLCTAVMEICPDCLQPPRSPAFQACHGKCPGRITHGNHNRH